jgi:hypothetical protein
MGSGFQLGGKKKLMRWMTVMEAEQCECLSCHQIVLLKMAKMDWTCGSSGTAPCWQIRSPEFKPQSHQTKTKHQNSLVPVVHTYNPSYLGGSQFKVNPGK